MQPKMNSFLLPIAKTDQGLYFLDKIHRNLYGDNEKKTNRFGDDKIIKIVMCLICSHIQYDEHLRVLRIPNRIAHRCTIAYNNNQQECIYLISDVKNDPDNTDSQLIEEVFYTEIKTIASSVNLCDLELPRGPPPSPASECSTPNVLDDELFQNYSLK